MELWRRLYLARTAGRGSGSRRYSCRDGPRGSYARRRTARSRCAPQHARNRGQRFEPGEDGRIDLMQHAIGRPHTLGFGAADPVRHQRDVRTGKCRIKVVTDQDALAADRIFRPELFAQCPIGYLRFQVRARHRCELCGGVGSLLHGPVPGFVLAIERFASGEQTLGFGQDSIQPPLASLWNSARSRPRGAR